MTDALIHRGPDGAGYWLNESSSVGLGHRRLAIIDLSECGKQPMTSCSGRYTVVFNGEIYNFSRIRQELASKGHQFKGQSDTEVMLSSFEEWGIEQSLPKLVGMFAFAVWDRELQHLVLARDRIGKKPLYYGFLGGGFAFGSELRALREFPGWQATIDRGSLALYMRHNYVPSPRSIYEGVKKLPAAHVLRVGFRSARPYEVSLQSYWSAAEVQQDAMSRPFGGTFEEATDELDRRLSDAVGLRMISDVPLGAFLSGGIDSSLVVALMQKQASSSVRTFTIGFDEAGYNEAQHAKAVAQHIGTAHTEMYVSPRDALAVIPKLPSIYDEPFADSSQIPTYLVSALARQHVTVVLSGDGGDEGFCGYNRYVWCKEILGKTSRLPTSVVRGISRSLRGISAPTLDRLVRSLYPLLPAKFRFSAPGDRLHRLAAIIAIRDAQKLYKQLVSHWTAPSEVVLGAAEPASLLDENFAAPGNEDIVNRMMLLDTLTYLPDDILVKVDRATMAVSLEARAPLLDHRVLEFAWSLPLNFKQRGRQGKLLLKNLLYRHVPEALVNRPKTGFGVPLDAWLRGPLRDWAESLLSVERLSRDGFFAVEPIRRLWTQHLSGSRQGHYLIWDVLMFQSWLESQSFDATTETVLTEQPALAADGY